MGIVNLSDIEPREVEWLFYPYVPFGKIVLLRGLPGQGKTMFVSNLLSMLSNGKQFNDTDIKTGNAVLLNAEDGLEDTIVPRLISCGADRNKIFTYSNCSNISFQDEKIERLIVQTEARILVFDPLQAFLGTRVNMNRANEVRGPMKHLEYLAEKYGCTIMLVEHLNKTASQNCLLRGVGSIDITACARSILVVAKSSDNKNVYLAHGKSNLGPIGETLEFELEGNSLKFVGKCDYSADEILALNSPDMFTSKRNLAITYMKNSLAKGTLPATTVYEILGCMNIGRRTVEDAKKQLGVKSSKTKDGWVWSL